MRDKPKILLISPTGMDKEGNPIIQRKTYLPGLTMPQLAAVTPKDFDVTIVAETSEPIPWDDDWDLVGLTGMGGSGLARGFQIADIFRKKGVKVVIGGMAATLFEPEYALAHCDVLMRGEADETWPIMLNDFKKGTLKSVYNMEKAPDIRNFPTPAYDKLNLKYYGFWRPVQATRGCPFPCTFCTISAFFKRSYRKRPVDQVVRDVRAAKASGSKYIAFIDDNIGVDFNYCKELFTALIPEKIIWISQCSLHLAEDEELLALASRSGCRILSFGIETTNESSLMHVEKEWNRPERYDSAFIKIKAAGIEVSTEMIVGLDGDDETVFDETFDFIMRNSIALPRNYIITPVPGTPMYKGLDAEGRIFDKDYSKYVGGTVVFEPKNMSVETLQNGYWSLYKKLYSTKNILRRLKRNHANLSPYMRLFVFGTNLVYQNHIRRGITPGIV
tara:strand:+ start:1409 stop:2743 length:1335 start_codon:yes stop_codon:yes gene_type:complete